MKHYSQKRTIYYLITVGLLSVFCVLASGRFYRVSAEPDTFTVTTTNDSGAGSLRQAIVDANANSGADTIDFDLGAGVHTIVLNSVLPTITDQVTIDGGGTPNTAPSPNPLNGAITVEIQGNSSLEYNIQVGTGGDGTVIKGLSLFDADAEQLLVRADDVAVQGNYLGVRADGITKGDNTAAKAGLYIESGADDLVGGTNPAERNVATGGPGDGISSISAAGTDTTVYGNYIGVGKDGMTDLGSTLGLALGGTGGIAGGTTAAKANVISGASTVCLLFTGNDNTAQGNYIGTTGAGTVSTSITSGLGVNLTAGASGNLIGGTNAGEGNIIKGVTGAGIYVQQMTINAYGPLDLISNKNAILGNSVSQIGIIDYPGFGNSNLGIDLSKAIDTSEMPDFQPDTFEQQGVTPNDTGDTDTGPNGYINYPVLKSAQQIGNQLTIHYDLDAADSPTNKYRVEFFANGESSIFGQGPGETYLGADTDVSPGTDKSVTLTVGSDYTNKALSATTTAKDASTGSGFGSTSEFSKNISVGSATDFDSDGISDSVEDQAPNNGDGNNDGIKDRLQPTVTTFEIDSSGIYATLVTDGCSENGTVASVDLSSLNTHDNGYQYPFGLTDFTLNCSSGDTVNVSLYIHAQTNPQKYVPRKFSSTSHAFSNLPGATLTNVSVGSSTALKLAYSITDGGSYDDDGTANGVIVDPVGLASQDTTSSSSGNGQELANTGMNTYALMTLAAAFIILGGVTAQRAKNSKKF